MCAAAWWAGSEPSEMTPRRKTDSSQASVPHAASLCNRAHSSLPHYRSNPTEGRRGGPRKVFPTTSTPQCGGQGKKAGSNVEVLSETAENAHLTCLSAVRQDARPASRGSTTARVITSTSSSYWGERGGAKCSTFSVSTSSEEDTRSAEAAARGEVTAGRASDLGERSWDLTGEDGDRDPSTRSRCEPHERRLRSTSA